MVRNEGGDRERSRPGRNWRYAVETKRGWKRCSHQRAFLSSWSSPWRLRRMRNLPHLTLHEAAAFLEGAGSQRLLSRRRAAVPPLWSQVQPSSSVQGRRVEVHGVLGSREGRGRRGKAVATLFQLKAESYSSWCGNELSLLSVREVSQAEREETRREEKRKKTFYFSRHKNVCWHQ
ncbi:uncharacterized protein PHA67_008545 isoform 1-T2 [Liasis olivaceus]